jgi:putative Mg2+ transporter-C (MgtC) family protein
MESHLLSDLWGAQTPLGTILVRLGAAILFGTIIGLDRELRRKPAGLRTHMLVSLAAATFTLLTFELVYRLDEAQMLEGVRADPIRIIEAVISGVAFLGAGSIIQSGGNIRGMTTGASIWLVGAVGLACGAGILDIAVIAFLLGLGILSVIGWLERYFEDEESSKGP